MKSSWNEHKKKHKLESIFFNLDPCVGLADPPPSGQGTPKALEGPPPEVEFQPILAFFRHKAPNFLDPKMDTQNVPPPPRVGPPSLVLAKLNKKKSRGVKFFSGQFLFLEIFAQITTTN